MTFSALGDPVRHKQKYGVPAKWVLKPSGFEAKEPGLAPALIVFVIVISVVFPGH